MILAVLSVQEAVQSGSSELFGEAAWANSGRYASEIGDMSEHVKLLKATR